MSVLCSQQVSHLVWQDYVATNVLASLSRKAPAEITTKTVQEMLLSLRQALNNILVHSVNR